MATITYVPGNIDYNKSGRRNCEVSFEVSYDGDRFSLCASIWNPRKTDIYAGGQIIEEAASYFPTDAKVQRMLAIWREWHLNDMKAGSPAQEAELKRHEWDRKGSYYDWAKSVLKAANLEPDTSYPHNGQPYSYGSAWLKREIPADVKAEIESWFE
jgi:hypothetical protein